MRLVLIKNIVHLADSAKNEDDNDKQKSVRLETFLV